MPTPETMIFICNSPKDGFREGDGDLMDMLASQLNKVTSDVGAIRIIGESPPEEIQRTNQLVVIDDLPEPNMESLEHLHPVQQKLIQYVVSHPAKNKIFYVGSRIDNFRKEEESFSISVGSGALLIEGVLLALKERNVKIVICCLEIVFYTRSLYASFKLYETLRHHLQHADAIHYLTARDKQYVEEELGKQLAAGARLVYPEYPTELIETILYKGKPSAFKKRAFLIEGMSQIFKSYFKNNEDQYKHYFSYFTEEQFLKKMQQIPGVYASGICCITGLSGDEIAPKKLVARKKNVLVFGLIRNHKGIEEGLALGKLFKEKKSESIVYIVGKILNICTSLKRIFREVFDEKSLKDQDISLTKRFSDCSSSEDYNKSFQQLYDDLIEARVAKKAQVVLLFNASETDLVTYSQKCRYVLKLDVKGFAENASSMISTMIGLYLPIIAQRGLVTPTFVQRYAPALHLLKGELRLNGREIVPEKADMNEVLSIIEESDEQYLKRLKAIHRIRATKQFDIETTTAILLRKVFLPFFYPLSSVSVFHGSPGRLRHGLFARSNSMPFLPQTVEHTDGDPLKLRSKL
jgi:hypothetical protein